MAAASKHTNYARLQEVQTIIIAPTTTNNINEDDFIYTPQERSMRGTMQKLT